jgi:predicted nucleotide-binding protein
MSAMSDVAERLQTLVEQLEALLEAARDDQKNRRWGTYDTLLSKYASIRDALWGLRAVMPWAADLPDLPTLPSSKRGAMLTGMSSVTLTGIGTAAEKALYTEMVATWGPLLKRVRRAAEDIKTPASCKASANRSTEEQCPAGARVIFVAYGHNEKARVAMFTFLRALYLFPMEWSYMKTLAGKPSASTREVVDAGLKAAGAFVILLTPDEKVVPAAPQRDGPGVGSREQARPNVLAELGETWSQNPSRTVIVSLGDAEPPSNYEGIQRVRIDNTAQARRQLAAALELAGRPVNDSGIDWLV